VNVPNVFDSDDVPAGVDLHIQRGRVCKAYAGIGSISTREGIAFNGQVDAALTDDGLSLPRSPVAYPAHLVVFDYSVVHAASGLNGNVCRLR
jgi:hypothetical protein